MRQIETTTFRVLLFFIVTGIMGVGLISCRDSAPTAKQDEDVRSVIESPIKPVSPLDHLFMGDIDELERIPGGRMDGTVIRSAGIASTIQLIGTLGGNTSEAMDNNDLGQVVGFSQTAGGETHAFLWEAGSGMIDLGTLGGPESVALGINNHGQVVGYSRLAGGELRAFLWEAGSGMTDLGTLGLAESVAYDINDSEEVVGYSNKILPIINRAFLWNANDGMTDLGTLGGAQSFAYGINELGEVVGRSQNTSAEEPAFFWEASAGMIDIGTLGGSWSYANAINNQSQVAGFSLITSNTAVHAFLWEAGSGMSGLGTLGGLSSYAYGINNEGQIVGYSETALNRYHGFIWDQTQGMVDLGFFMNATLPYSRARSINNNGQIVGTSGNASGQFEAAIWNAQLDDTPPAISFTQEVESLWPPNHKMVLAVSGISAVDDVDGPVPPSVEVSSNEAVNGKGDGNTSPDWEIVDNADGSFDVYLRAERSGRGEGRVYTVTITAEDAAGNPAEEIVEVTVPHNRGR